MIKKILLVFIISTMMLSITACEEPEITEKDIQQAEENAKLTIVDKTADKPADTNSLDNTKSGVEISTGIDEDEQISTIETEKKIEVIAPIVQPKIEEPKPAEKPELPKPILVVSPTPAKNETATKDRNETPKNTTGDAIAPEVRQEKFVADMPDKLQSLLEMADKRVQSYQFYYAPPPANLQRDRWYVKGNRIVVKTFEVNYVKPMEYYDTIYIDAKNKTVVAYCEDVMGKCQKWDKMYPLNYNNIIIKTPYQWVKEIPYGELQGSEMLWGRQTQKVYYERNGLAYKLWIDEYSGLPLRVIIKRPNKDDERYEFRDLAINSVPDDMLYHKSKPGMSGTLK